MAEADDVDRMRREALDALRVLSDSVGVVKEKLAALLERDPDIVPESDEHLLSDKEFVVRRSDRLDQECQALLYMVTGLYGRAMVAEMAGVDGDADPLQ